MITKIQTISSNTCYPYFNMALEKHLFDLVDDETVVLYFYENEKTAVCGADQDMTKEVFLDKLIDDGGYPTRRLSGGTSFFLDKGTLNYTFLCKEANFDILRQQQVLIQACALCGLTVSQTSSHQLSAGNLIIAESDVYQKGVRGYHHGAILVHSDPEAFSNYMTSDHHLDPDRSRYTSLAAFAPDLTVETMRQQMIRAFEEIYQLKTSPVLPETLEPAVIESYEKIFSDDSWLYQNSAR